MKEFTEFLEVLSVMPENFVLSGDINFHLETDDQHVKTLMNTLKMFNLVQYVNFPTHKLGHTLDLVITRDDAPNVTDISAENVHLSDHFMITFNVEAEAVKNELKTITYRNLGLVNNQQFTEDLSDRYNCRANTMFGEEISRYNMVMKELLDKHAPLVTKTIKVVPMAPWFDEEYKQLRKKRRKAERKFKRSKLPADRERFIHLRKETTLLARKKKQEHYGNKIAQCSTSKELYNCVNELLDKKKESVLPTHNSSAELATEFNMYFKEKISIIRKSFPVETHDRQTTPTFAGNPLNNFRPTDEEEVKTIIKRYGIKCSPEDPLPAKLLSAHIEQFSPIWTELVNLSLEQGSIDCLKSAVVLPLIKELDSLDVEIKKNYRPISNLQFVGKLIERVVAIRLDEHMESNHLHSSKQYGYKIDHCTEMLLLKVVNDLLLACDKKTPSLVMFLDLSAAFDTVDQGKLLGILENDIGVTGTALKWCDSFLRGRTQKVKINDEYSDEETLDFGVPQGSILGPKFFNIYTKPFPGTMQVVHMSVEGYADDHQLQKQFNLMFQVEVLGEGINKTFQVIDSWMKEFFLKLNSSKTKIMIVVPECLRSEIIINGTFIDGNCIRFVDSAKNLGVIIDSVLSLDKQVSKVVTTCYHTLRQLSRIKSFLSVSHLQTLVCTLVLSNLDYCNSLYYRLSAENISKLQSVQNSAARLACKVNRFDRMHTTDLFFKLHWLAVKARIVFKILLIVHKCILKRAPHDIVDMVRFAQSSRMLLLETMKCNGAMGERAFAVCGPKLWNALPKRIRIVESTEDFKKILKTYLFTEFDDFNSFVNRK